MLSDLVYRRPCLFYQNLWTISFSLRILVDCRGVYDVHVLANDFTGILGLWKSGSHIMGSSLRVKVRFCKLELL